MAGSRAPKPAAAAQAAARKRAPAGGTRGPGTRTTEAEQAAIAEALRNGESIHAVAKRTGHSTSTVGRIGRKAGVSPTRAALEKADAARLTRAEAAAAFGESVQLDGLRKLAAVIIERIDESQIARIKPLEMQQMATAYAIIIDKWRLIEGEATARTEVASQGARERLAARIDELAARRQQTPPASQTG